MLLKDRVALVTGAAQGMGRGIAQALAEEGAAVAVTDIQQDGGAETATMVEKLGVRASAFTMDVTSEASVAQTLEAVVREFGHLDVLVNNAGVIKMKSVFGHLRDRLRGHVRRQCEGRPPLLANSRRNR